MQFFSPDSKFAQVMTFVGEMMLLNLCWILASLPLVTAGAANIAMYTIMGRRLRKEDNGTLIPFFKAWKSNLKQGVLFWLAQVLMSAGLALYFFLPLPTAFKIIAGLVLVLVTLVFSILYPMIARFRNRWFASVKNALILLVAKPGWALLNLLLILLPVALLALAPVEFLRFGFIWLLFGFSGIFYLSAMVMRKILLPMENMHQHK